MSISKPICIRCEYIKIEDCWIAQSGYECWIKSSPFSFPKEEPEKCPYKLEPSWEEEEIKKRTKKAPTQIEQELEKVKRKSKYGL